VQYLVLGIQCLVGTVFLVSATSKVVGRHAFCQFVTSVGGLLRLPPGRARPIALLVVVAEYAVCVLLAPPQPVPAAGLALTAVLLASFTVVIAFALRHGVSAPCRCFGAATTPPGIRHMTRNLLLALAAIVGVVAGRTTAPVHPGGVVVAVLTGLVVGVLVCLLDDIVDLFQPVKNVPDAAGGLR
jgi:hypothetical protein